MSFSTTRKHLTWAAVAAASALALTACSSGGGAEGAASGDSGDPIRIGVVISAEEYWTIFTEAAAEEGIEVELVNFSDYQLPNQGLTDGDLDLNQFQHLQFLAGYNVNSGSDLTPIGATAVYADVDRSHTQPDGTIRYENVFLWAAGKRM